MKTAHLIQCRLHKSPPPVLFDAPQDEEVARTRTFLAHATRVMHRPAHHQPVILQDEGVKEFVYLLTVWPNLEAYTEWAKTESRNELVAHVQEIADIETVGLYELEHDNMPLKASILALTFINVAANDCDAFHKDHDEVRKDLEKFSHHPVATGWKVKEFQMEKDQLVEKPVVTKGGDTDRREYIVFSGYETVERRMEFASADPKRFERYSDAIKRHNQWFERRNARLIDIK